MQAHSTIQTSYGPTWVMLGQYACGELAVVLETDDGPLAKLSVYIAEFSPELESNQFYVKTWSADKKLIPWALDLGLLKVVDSVGVPTGWVSVPLWELV